MQLLVHQVAYLLKNVSIIAGSSASLSAENNMAVSSAYKNLSIFFVQSWKRSLINKINNKGDTIDPWGTPADIYSNEE